MCLAISKPAGAVIPVEHLRNGHQENPHGCGFVYSENGKLTIVKGLFTFDEFYAKYKEKEHLPMLVHFRFSTHGKPNLTNCHPFSILNGKYALIHNGVIKIHCSIEHLSDTGNFSKLVMEPMLKLGCEPDKPSFKFLVETAIGDGNKICLMADDGSVTIYNEEAGTTEDAVDADGNEIVIKYEDGTQEPAKVWYSNSGYKNCRRRRCHNRKNENKHQDEYEGIYNCGDGEQAISKEEADIVQATAQEVDLAFGDRARLDPPPNPDRVIAGFKAGVKSINSVEQVMEAYDAIHQRSPGKYPPSSKNSTKEIISGPIFDPPTEVEISFLESNKGLTRSEAIHYLQLQNDDAAAYAR